MADKFERFSVRARHVVALADEEARALQHNYIGTEHLLLGLVREGEGIAGRVLANLGVSIEQARREVSAVVRPGAEVVSGEIGLTPRAKKVIELAVKEAKRLNHGYIGTEHLLLGMVREGHGIACGVLQSFGLEFERVRSETFCVLSDHAPVGNRLKHYNLTLPEDLFDELQQLADREHTTVVDLLRRFIKLGLLAIRVNETPGSALIIREGEKEREILLL